MEKMSIYDIYNVRIYMKNVFSQTTHKKEKKKELTEFPSVFL
jgi:hypothetical protein